MTVNFTFRKIEATEALKERIQKRVAKLEKYITYPMDVHVLCSVEKTLQCAEITCHAEHRELVAVAKTKDLYESIDTVAHKIETQLKKEREKKKGHTAAGRAARTSSLRHANDVAAAEQIPHRAKKVNGSREA